MITEHNWIIDRQFWHRWSIPQVISSSCNDVDQWCKTSHFLELPMSMIIFSSILRYRISNIDVKIFLSNWASWLLSKNMSRMCVNFDNQSSWSISKYIHEIHPLVYEKKNNDNVFAPNSFCKTYYQFCGLFESMSSIDIHLCWSLLLRIDKLLPIN